VVWWLAGVWALVVRGQCSPNAVVPGRCVCGRWWSRLQNEYRGGGEGSLGMNPEGRKNGLVPVRRCWWSGRLQVAGPVGQVVPARRWW